MISSPRASPSSRSSTPSSLNTAPSPTSSRPSTASASWPGSCLSFISCWASPSLFLSSASGPCAPQPLHRPHPRLTTKFWTALVLKPRARPRTDSMLASFLLLFFDSSVWTALGACLCLATAVFLFVFYIRPDASDLAPHRTKLDQLLERRDTIYDNLRDLKFEFRAGKYSEGDYELMMTSLETRAALVLPQTDELTEAQVRRPRAVRPAATERGAR